MFGAGFVGSPDILRGVIRMGDTSPSRLMLLNNSEYIYCDGSDLTSIMWSFLCDWLAADLMDQGG